jgi:N-acylneuraminate cytidylyltransferase
MDKLKNLAIIPARGGSKRIPGKNIRNFLGKPIIAYSIETARESRLFDRIIVSTDSEEIAEIAKSFEAEVPFHRSSRNSGDNATLSDVIEEVQHELEKQGYFFEYICCILPTAPLMTSTSLKSGLELLETGGFSSVRPVVAYSYPVQRAFKMENQKVEFLYPEFKSTRSQDLEKTYHDAAQFYWIRADKGLADENRGAFEIPEINVQDIDNENDWSLAELKYKLQNQV